MNFGKIIVTWCITSLLSVSRIPVPQFDRLEHIDTGTRNERIKLNYPVILVHGIAMHDRTSIIKIWGRIPQTLEESGVQVYFGNTDAWGDYESNALILKETIEKILLETKKEKVNIIAHSKGGIDSRYLIWKYDFHDKIASLITICTPHLGSEVADLTYDQKLMHTQIAKDALALYGKLSNDANPNLYKVNYQLTTMQMKEFNEKIPMDERIYHRSLYTTMNDAFDDRVFARTFLHIQKIAGENDGLVSAQSAGWGTNVAKIADGVSHTEILDIKMRRVSGMHIPDIYIDIVKDLSHKGF
jgi:triacylglycerol lipase